MRNATIVFIFVVSILGVAVMVVISCLENAGDFIFYVGFGKLHPFLFKICVGGSL